jgi:hypothetical protein
MGGLAGVGSTEAFRRVGGVVGMGGWDGER